MGTVLFKIGDLSFFTYGLFIVIGVFLASLNLYISAKKQNRNTELVFDLVLFCLLFGLIGARINYFLLYHSQFQSIIELFKVWEGGMVSWGGFIFAGVAFFIIIKQYKEKPLPWLDIFTISALLGLSVGRLGSFLSGEYAGRSSGSFLSIHGSYPVTLFESVLLLIVFVAIMWYYNMKKFKNNGDYAICAVVTYSLIRFIMDFFRTNNNYLLGLTLTQIVSSIFILVMVILIFIRMLASRKRS